LVGAGLWIPAAGAQKAEQPDLAEYRTVDQAITTRISKASPTLAGVPAYLGIHAVPAPNAKLVIDHVEPDSPAAKAGFQKGDEIVSVPDHPAASFEALREQVRTPAPQDTLTTGVVRGTSSMKLTATLAPLSRPMKAGSQRAVIGVQVGDVKDGGIPLTDVTANGAAGKAGLKKGDIVLK